MCEALGVSRTSLREAFRQLEADGAFAERGSPEEAEAMSASIDRFERAATAGDSGEMIRAKTAFYGTLLDAGRNVFVSDALRRLHNRITLLRVPSMTQTCRLPDSVRELRAIHAAIAARDPEAAARLCHEHIENAARIALAVLAKTEGQAGEIPRSPAISPARGGRKRERVGRCRTIARTHRARARRPRTPGADAGPGRARRFRC